MENPKTVLLAIAGFIATIFFISHVGFIFIGGCPQSRKGRWMEVDKVVAKTACYETITKTNPNLNEEQIARICDCTTQKLEAKVESWAEVLKTGYPYPDGTCVLQEMRQVDSIAKFSSVEK